MGKISEFGTWQSPITSDMVVEKSRNFFRGNNIHVSNGVMFWNESRPDEAGRVVICSATVQQQTKGEFSEWTPPEFSAQSSVHEYGGGAFWVSPTSPHLPATTIYFVNASDQRIYQQTDPTSVPEPITPDNNSCRYADGVVAKSGAVMFVVCEDHSRMEKKEATEPTNTLVSIDLKTNGMNKVASGADFYASPTISSDGTRLAWMQWDHPNMPWDSTSISMWQLDPTSGNPIPGTITKILNEPSVSYVAPVFANGPNNDLYYASDQTNWWNVFSISTKNIQKGGKTIYPQNTEQCGPHWSFGNTIFALEQGNDVSNRIVIGQNHYSELNLVNLGSGATQKLDTGYKVHFCVTFCAVTNRVYFFGGAPDKWNAVVAYDVAAGTVSLDPTFIWGILTTVIRSAKASPIPADYVSIPTHITFPTTPDECNSSAHAYFYPPHNPNYTGPEGSLPPLIVMAHGGPTGATSPILDLKRMYYTSRGFAILDVNYRGSTGYGRKFRELLRKQWGIRDIDDCCCGAKYLVEKGMVDGTKLCITGGSAGGYVVLAALTFKDVFHVGASHYGISDLVALEEETHKFESKYNFSLIGPYPEAKAIYEQRSPIHFTDQLNTPVAFFQGSVDKIVPPNQSEMLFEVAKKKGLPTAYTLFEGEGHGFSKAENVKTALDGEYYFFCSVLGMATTDMSQKINIINLPKK